MSIDGSLKTSGNLSQHRNVLTRAERIKKLAEKGRFDLASGDPTGLPKVMNKKIGAKKTKKKGPDAEGEDAT